MGREEAVCRGAEVQGSLNLILVRYLLLDLHSTATLFDVLTLWRCLSAMSGCALSSINLLLFRANQAALYAVCMSPAQMRSNPGTRQQHSKRAVSALHGSPLPYTSTSTYQHPLAMLDCESRMTIDAADAIREVTGDTTLASRTGFCENRSVPGYSESAIDARGEIRIIA